MKKLINYLVVCVSLMMPLIVFATNANSGVCKYNSGSDCSNYQDKSINAKGTVYFSHQMITYCKDNRYQNPTYMNPDYKVTCANGNTNPQTSLVSSGCPKVGNMCNSYKYCSGPRSCI